jgi:hypothetical protein
LHASKQIIFKKGQKKMKSSQTKFTVTFATALLKIKVNETEVKTGRTKIAKLLWQNGAKHGAQASER